MEKQAKVGRLLKQHMVNEIASALKGASSLFITDCGKLTNAQLIDLKRRLKKSSGDYIVVKNSMCALALDKIGVAAQVKELLKGTCGIGYSGKDPVSTSKILVDFIKENEKFAVKGAYIDGKAVSVSVVKELAAMPPKEVLIARLVSSMNSPISGVVVTLSGIVRKFVYALNAVKMKKTKEGGQ